MLGQITQQQEVDEHMHFCTARRHSWAGKRSATEISWFLKCVFEVWRRNWNNMELLMWLFMRDDYCWGRLLHLLFMAIRCVTVRGLWCGKSWCEQGEVREAGGIHWEECVVVGGGGSLLAKVFDSLINISFDNARWSVTASIYEVALPARGCTHVHTHTHTDCVFHRWTHKQQDYT